MDLDDIIASLQDLEDDEFEERGLSVTGTWDEVDDPILIGPTEPRWTRGSRGTPTTIACPGASTR